MATILVVEDEPTIREVLCEFVGANHTCLCFRTAEEGLAALADASVDVAVSDIKLPGIDGREFLHRDLELRPELPVILISGATGTTRRPTRRRAPSGTCSSRSGPRIWRSWSRAPSVLDKISPV